MSTDDRTKYVVPEVSAIFMDAVKVEQAITDLQEHGFSRPDISFMAGHDAIEKSWAIITSKLRKWHLTPVLCDATIA
jgi:hypothetical protein